MKKVWKIKIITWLMIAVMVGMFTAPSAVKAEENAVTKIYYQNTEEWSSVYVWAWTMKYTDQLVANPWPGDAATDLGNGWFSYELQPGEAFAVLFNNGDSAGIKQTADCPDLQAGKTYWITAGKGSVENDTGIGGGSNIVVHEEAQAGWPEGPEAVPASADAGNSIVTKIIPLLAAGAVIIIAAFILLRKKKKVS